jgi:hypothetical protein
MAIVGRTPHNFDGVSLHHLADIFSDSHVVGIAIRCRDGTVKLEVPRVLWPTEHDGPSESKQQVLAALHTQIINQIAIISLEDK